MSRKQTSEVMYGIVAHIDDPLRNLETLGDILVLGSLAGFVRALQNSLNEFVDRLPVDGEHFRGVSIVPISYEGSQ